MIYGKFVSPHFKRNAIFDLAHPWNRDNCFQPYHALREKFKDSGALINTGDMVADGKPYFELHMDAVIAPGNLPSYVLLLETPMVCPENALKSNLGKYRKVFTWRDDWVDGDRFIKINFPNPIRVHPVDGFADRDRFCCLIAGNRAMESRDPRILYSERVNAIRWFEQNAPEDFDLYGIGWNMPPVRPGLQGKVQRRVWGALSKFLPLKPFPSYRGKVEHKKDVLTRTRYAICYENVRDLPGYITEKIFDCFFSGCVPVYWGASNIAEHIPENCFIDRRKFSDSESVYRYLKSITEDEYRSYQESIASFLQSDAAYPFGVDFFAETIVSTIVQDLGC